MKTEFFNNEGLDLKNVSVPELIFKDNEPFFIENGKEKSINQEDFRIYPIHKGEYLYLMVIRYMDGEVIYKIESSGMTDNTFFRNNYDNIVPVNNRFISYKSAYSGNKIMFGIDEYDATHNRHTK